MATKTILPANATESEGSPPSLRYYSDTTEGSTFESPKLRQWTESHLEGAGRVLNPCAGNARLDVDGEVLRVDVNEDADADLHIDFRNLLEHADPDSFDAIVYDPPYSYNQAVSKYGLDIDRGGFYFFGDEVMELFDTLLAPGGVFIQFGYTTAAMPPELGYSVVGVGLFNKLGSQNDYLGIALEKPEVRPSETLPLTVEDAVLPNVDADQISDNDVSAGGNGGDPIGMRYQRSGRNTEYEAAVSDAVNQWVNSTDRVLHIYESNPTVEPASAEVTRCAYRCVDLQAPDGEVAADVVETPWNIASTFATGVFDTVILDLPYSAFQQNIRTPWKEAASGGDKTHVATAVKRGITDLVCGDGGRVIQIGRTATLMSGLDYDYRRAGVSIIQHPSKDTDRIVVVDEKPHENLETVGLPDGEVDRYETHHIITGRDDATGTASKYSRTDLPPSDSAHFCVHCGNHFYYHPAMYLSCVECGAQPGNYCVDSDGDVLYGTIHDSRVSDAADRHSGSCNHKKPSCLSASEDRVKAIVGALEEHVNPEDLDEGFTEDTLRRRLETEVAETPRSTDVVERVLSELRAPTLSAAPRSGETPSSTTETSLSDYL